MGVSVLVYGEFPMSYDGRIHTVHVGNVRRDLPLFKIAPGVTIAIFNMLGDTEVKIGRAHV